MQECVHNYILTKGSKLEMSEFRRKCTLELMRVASILTLNTNLTIQKTKETMTALSNHGMIFSVPIVYSTIIP